MKSNKNIFIPFFLIFSLLLSSISVFAKPIRSIPSAPTALTTTNIASSEIDITWQTVSNASGYKVFRATPNDSNYSLLASVTTNSFKNVSLSASTIYWYYVQAFNSYGTSSSSAHLKVTTNAVTTIASSKQVLGFTTYYYSGDASSYNSMTSNTSLLNQIATDTYTTDGLGNISGLIPTNQISYANSNGIKTLAMLTNTFDGNIAKTLLENPTNRQNLINNTVAALKTNGYKGVNVDLEGVYYYDRSYLTTFMSELYNTLKPQGFTVTMAVPAKTYDSLTDSWNGAFDYAQLSNYNDELVLMAYDEHYPGGTPGAIASIGWVQSVVNYAVTAIPKEKLLIGVAAYGYDWSSNGTKAYGITGINNLAATYGAQIKWDTTSQSPYFNYTDSTGVSHSVWFENGTSVAYKLDLVNNNNLAGVGIWRLGLEDSNYWTTIKTKFNK